MKFTLNVFLLFICILSNSQVKSVKEQPYLETIAQADTLISPDRIYLNIILTEQDSKGKTPIETLDNQLENTLNGLGIETSKQLFLSDLSSRFKRYFLKQKNVYKAKEYSLLVFEVSTASAVLEALEKINISNVTLEKAIYSKMDELELILKNKLQ